MTPHQYLEEILERNKFEQEQNDETAAERSQDIREKLEGEFGSKIYTIRYSGSIAKHTAVAGSHDVDLAVHFKHDALDTLKSMYDAVHDFLKKHYTVKKQKVSIGIPDRDVDVVPGRLIMEDPDSCDNDDRYDMNIYRTDTDSYIKTNIVKQIEHVRKSGVRDAIKLTKIWRDAWGAHFKSFAVELLVIKALKDFDGSGLDNKFRTVLTKIRDEIKTIRLEDPGNSNNNVADAIDDADKDYLKKIAEKCLGYLTGEEKKKEPDMVAAWKRVFKDTSSTTSSAAPTYIVKDARIHVDRTNG